MRYPPPGQAEAETPRQNYARKSLSKKHKKSGTIFKQHPTLHNAPNKTPLLENFSNPTVMGLLSSRTSLLSPSYLLPLLILLSIFSLSAVFLLYKVKLEE